MCSPDERSFRRALLQQQQQFGGDRFFEGSDAQLGSHLPANMVLQTGSSLENAAAVESARKISDRHEDDGLGSSDDDTISSSSHEEVVAFSAVAAAADPEAAPGGPAVADDGFAGEVRVRKAPASTDDLRDPEDDGGVIRSRKGQGDDIEVLQVVKPPLLPASPVQKDVGSEAEDAGWSIEGPDLQIQRRKVILPDQSAIKHLLAFDEEEEEDDFEEEEQDEEVELKKSSSAGWHKTIVKDMANLSPAHPNQPAQPSGGGLHRRHSISICDSQSKKRRNSPPSSSAAPSANELSCPQQPAASLQLDVSQMQANLQDELQSKKTEALQTLDLRLEEVAHIRSVLTKAELEGLPIAGSVRADVEKGKVCFLCMKTKFGLFSRGHKCEMCKQLVCSKCQSTMKIPLEHFTNTPVFALSPMSNINNNNLMSLCAYNSAEGTGHEPSTTTSKEKKVSLPDSLGLLDHKSVGSAPNSPRLDKRIPDDDDGDQSGHEWSVPTISGAVGTTGVAPAAAAFCGPTSLPPMAYQKGKYATLPTKNRRLSMITPSSRDAERQKLEGSPLTVCSDCKDMVVQVIRASRTTRRMQMVRSMFTSFSQFGHKSP